MTLPIEEELASLYARLRSRVREEYQRDLPLQELLTDRWERAQSLGFGAESSIYQSAYVYGDVRVGARTWIGPFALLDGSGGLTIGSGCDISAGVHLYSHDTVERVLSEGSRDVAQTPTVVEDFCHIGAHAVIARGVTIGDHSVVGACAFVNRDVPPYTVVAGVPARAIGRVQIGESGDVALAFDSDGRLG